MQTITFHWPSVATGLICGAPLWSILSIVGAMSVAMYSDRKKKARLKEASERGQTHSRD